jgi:OHCU decarboxylase
MDRSPSQLSRLNELPEPEATAEFLKCCGSHNWAQRMSASRPFANLEELRKRATDLWWSVESADWLEAFRSHPKIGEKKATAEVSNQSQSWSSQEQSGIASAAASTLSELAQLNREYEEKFGYIFIVCATGKSSDEMLAILRSRIVNIPNDELRVAAAEQAKITEIRLRKLIE